MRRADAYKCTSCSYRAFRYRFAYKWKSDILTCQAVRREMFCGSSGSFEAISPETKCLVYLKDATHVTLDQVRER